MRNFITSFLLLAPLSGCASVAQFDAAIAQGAALVVPAESVACEIAQDLDPTGATAVCTEIDAAGNAAGAVFATLPTTAAIVSALTAKAPPKTPAVQAALTAGHAALAAQAIVIKTASLGVKK